MKITLIHMSQRSDRGRRRRSVWTETRRDRRRKRMRMGADVFHSFW